MSVGQPCLPAKKSARVESRPGKSSGKSGVSLCRGMGWISCLCKH